MPQQLDNEATIAFQAADYGLDTQTYLAKLHEEFPFFLHEVWSSANLPEPSLVQYDIASYLQTGRARRCIKGFRGVAKTWITIAYILWRLYRNVNEHVLLVSESLGHSRKSLHLARQWIDNIAFLSFLAPKKGTKQRDSGEMFDVGPSEWDRVASVTAMGITGQIVGGRSTLIVGDDIETNENTLTREQRAMIRSRIEEFAFIVRPGGDIIFLGTPHHEETVYDELPDKGYDVRAWPAEYVDPQQGDTPFLAPILARHLADGIAKIGDPTWPEQFNEDVLLKTKLDGKSKYAMQMLLKSGLADEELYPLKLADLIVFPINRDKAPATIAWGKTNNRGSTAVQDIPSAGFAEDMFYSPAMIDENWLPYYGAKAFIDPAGGGKDEIAWAIAKQLHGYIFCPCVGGMNGGPSVENLDTIVLSLREHRVTDLYVETNFGGEMLIQLLRPIVDRHAIKSDPADTTVKPWNCVIFGVHNVGQKEARIIDTLEPVMNQHRLVIDPSVAADAALQKQITRITRQRGSLEHDDRLDALAGVVAQWRDVLDVDATKQAALAKRRTQEQRLREYYSERFSPLSGPCWIKY